MKIKCFLMIYLFSGAVFAAESLIPLEKAQIDPSDRASLQRGAKLYMNNCQGCHSLNYVRYSSMGQIIGLVTDEGKLDKELLSQNLQFGHAKIHDGIKVSMPEADAREWFGVLPPDLTLVTRVRGVDWVFTYLKSFYVDEGRVWGTNNLVFPDVAMPNVLVALQGELVPIMAKNADGKDYVHHLEYASKGRYSPRQFDAAVRDIVNFLHAMAEPKRAERHNLGWFVLIFVAFMIPFLYLLKREYWKDIKRK